MSRAACTGSQHAKRHVSSVSSKRTDLRLELRFLLLDGDHTLQLRRLRFLRRTQAIKTVHFPAMSRHRTTPSSPLTRCRETQESRRCDLPPSLPVPVPVNLPDAPDLQLTWMLWAQRRLLPPPFMNQRLNRDVEGRFQRHLVDNERKRRRIETSMFKTCRTVAVV